MSLESYLEFERTSDARHEFIDGEVYLMAGGTTNHGILSLNLGAILLGLLRGSPCRAYPSDVRVRIAETRYVYPDISISCDERDRGDREDIRYPRVVIEVLSPSTEAYDRGDKFRDYRECPSLQEYVLVNSRRREIEVFRREGDFWVLHGFGPSGNVELASVGISFPVVDVYDGVDLADSTRRDPSAM